MKDPLRQQGSLSSSLSFTLSLSLPYHCLPLALLFCSAFVPF
uniref:Uncharacterized protein n=1 Tax=Anguilla anguilla TaxID=7936 RepID=A0A0E9RWT0_ANGAN